MPPKRTYNKKARKIYSKYGKKKPVDIAVRTLQASMRRLLSRQKRTYSMIETKECQYKSYPNTSLNHNLPYIVKIDAAQLTQLNPFITLSSTSDPSQANAGGRIGDQINVKGMKIVGFLENSLGRPKVFYRVMLVRCAKGDTIDRTTLFKGDSDNKMIDVVNTERFTIVAQRRFTVSASNAQANALNVINGEPYTTAGLAGIGTKVFNMWIPGRKFGKYGKIQYENGSTSQVKFYDYRVVILAYDWYGTPQDLNAIGKLNELYTKVYFKDA